MPKARPTQPADLAGLEAALGHTFARPDLLAQALTHRSQAFELAMETTGKPEEGERADNQRLEFLGDAIIGLVVAEALFESNPDWQEGELTRLRAQLVNRRNMAEVAAAIGLGEHLRLGKGEERSGGRKKAAILANAMEAVIAAIFLDASLHAKDDGGLQAVRIFARRHILGDAAEELARELRSGAALGDHKSALQVHLQAVHAGVPAYVLENESGPDHRKRFRVQLRIKSTDGRLGAPISSGIGTTKKKAEQEAARRGLAHLISHEESITELAAAAGLQLASEEAAKV